MKYTVQMPGFMYLAFFPRYEFMSKILGVVSVSTVSICIRLVRLFRTVVVDNHNPRHTNEHFSGPA